MGEHMRKDIPTEGDGTRGGDNPEPGQKPCHEFLRHDVAQQPVKGAAQHHVEIVEGDDKQRHEREDHRRQGNRRRHMRDQPNVNPPANLRREAQQDNRGDGDGGGHRQKRNATTPRSAMFIALSADSRQKDQVDDTRDASRHDSDHRVGGMQFRQIQRSKPGEDVLKEDECKLTPQKPCQQDQQTAEGVAERSDPISFQGFFDRDGLGRWGGCLHKVFSEGVGENR